MSDEESDADERYADHDAPRYRDVAEIGRADLYEALMTLAGFSENPMLVMQASQLCLVDNMLIGIEQEVICPLLSGPKLMIFWIAKETRNAEQEASPGGDYRQTA